MDASHNIKNLRLKLQMSQMQFAIALHSSLSSIANYENSRRNPSLKTVMRIINLAKKHGIKIGIEDIFSE